MDDGTNVFRGINTRTPWSLLPQLLMCMLLAPGNKVVGVAHPYNCGNDTDTWCANYNSSDSNTRCLGMMPHPICLLLGKVNCSSAESLPPSCPRSVHCRTQPWPNGTIAAKLQLRVPARWNSSLYASGERHKLRHRCGQRVLDAGTGIWVHKQRCGVSSGEQSRAWQYVALRHAF